MKLHVCLVVPFLLTFAWGGTAFAGHISSILDVPGLRTSLPDQGYLSFHFAFSPNGEERTGWTDIRHPALHGTPDSVHGFDRSDFNVNVNTHVVNAGAGASASPNIIRDFEYASAAFAQAGISVIQGGEQTLTNAEFLAIDNIAELDQMFGQQQAADMVNAYYVQTITTTTSGPVIGFTRSPEDPTDGIAMADAADNDTMAHELGHFLIDSHRFAPGDSFHDGSSKNELMAPGIVTVSGRSSNFRNKPTNLLQVGRPNGNIGGRDQMATLVHLKGDAATEVHQERAYNEAPTVSHVDNGLNYGDIADFDWVEDNLFLEAAGGLADNHDGTDWMVWEIGPIAPSAHTAPDGGSHNHDDWGSLALNAFDKETFRLVDVVSQLAWWTDMDVDADGDWSFRESALDYLLQFSFNGTD